MELVIHFIPVFIQVFRSTNFKHPSRERIIRKKSFSWPLFLKGIKIMKMELLLMGEEALPVVLLNLT